MILAAGTIHSPKLLMLSGVGKAKALRSLGIDLVENLPGVGQNLQDHAAASVVYRSAHPLPSGVRTKAGELSMPRNAISLWKWSDMYCEP